MSTNYGDSLRSPLADTIINTISSQLTEGLEVEKGIVWGDSATVRVGEDGEADLEFRCKDKVRDVEDWYEAYFKLEREREREVMYSRPGGVKMKQAKGEGVKVEVVVEVRFGGTMEIEDLEVVAKLEGEGGTVYENGRGGGAQSPSPPHDSEGGGSEALEPLFGRMTVGEDAGACYFKTTKHKVSLKVS